MKYKWKKKTTVGIMVLLTATVLGGCQKPATPENLFRDLVFNLASVESVKENQIVSLEMGEGDNVVRQESNLDIETTIDPAAVHRKGQQKTDMAGTEETQELESYQLKEDGKTVIYSGSDEAWEKTDVKEKATTENTKLLFEDLQDLDWLFQVSQDLADVNKEECFELTGEISGTQFRDAFEDSLVTLLGEDSSDLSGWNLQTEEETTDIQKKMDDVTVNCTVDIYRSNILPAKLTFDLTDYLNAVGTEETQVSAYTLEVTFLSYNDVKKMKVPDDVKALVADQTEETTGNEEDGTADADGKEETATEAGVSEGIHSEVEGAAPQSAELGASWNSYTVQINDKVLTLPCTIADLESTGLQFDEKSLPKDYEIEAGDYQNAWLKDDSKNTIMVDLINTSEQEKEAKDCLVGGIYVEQYSLKNENLKVTFPGGIELGTSLDAVLTTYGEPTQKTEGDLVHVYDWYEDGSYYNSCEIDTNSTDRTVTMMGISRFEMKKES